MKVAIIGAGLAGCAAAYVLKQAGVTPVIYEMGKEIAPAASGNSIGLYNPRLSAEPGFYAEAFPLALETFGQLKDIGWNKCGALHLVTDEKRETRYRQAIQNWNWSDYGMRIVTKAEASAIAGVALDYDALYLPDSGSVSPKKLCEAYAAGVEIHFGQKVAEIKADAVIWAAGMGTAGFPLKGVRGQITDVKATAGSASLKTNLCYGGYITAAQNGRHMVGSTFQRWLDHSQIIAQDDDDNIRKAMKFIPSLGEGFKIIGHRAGVRTTTPDHFPVIGQVKDNIYVSTGHGSHGIVSSIAAAYILAAMILNQKSSFKSESLRKINPARFGAGFAG